MIHQHLISEAKALCASWRWSDPNTPGSSQVPELFTRVASPEQYAEFRATPEGAFLLAVIEAYEEALNDDWMPVEVCGMKLEHAKTYIGLVAEELETHDVALAVSHLKERYVYLSEL